MPDPCPHRSTLERVIHLAGWLAIGAIINFTLASGLSYFAKHAATFTWPPNGTPVAPQWPGYVPASIPPCRAGIQRRYRGFLTIVERWGWENNISLDDYLNGRAANLGASVEIVSIAAGWPLPTCVLDKYTDSALPAWPVPQRMTDWRRAAGLRAGLVLRPENPATGGGEIRLAVVPVMPGLLLGGLFWGVVARFSSFVIARVRRRLRRRPDLCPTCGYMVAILPRCPECGTSTPQIPK